MAWSTIMTVAASVSVAATFSCRAAAPPVAASQETARLPGATCAATAVESADDDSAGVLRGDLEACPHPAPAYRSGSRHRGRRHAPPRSSRSTATPHRGRLRPPPRSTALRPGARSAWRAPTGRFHRSARGAAPAHRRRAGPGRRPAIWALALTAVPVLATTLAWEMSPLSSAAPAAFAAATCVADGAATAVCTVLAGLGEPLRLRRGAVLRLRRVLRWNRPR